MADGELPAAASGVFSLGGTVAVTRLGYGAMRITGPGIWGAPPDREVAIKVLRRAVELGVDFIDTADSYGPCVSEELIREALHPYDGVTIATKGGLTRSGPDQWGTVGRPEYLRQCVEMSLRRLGLDTIDLYQLHRIDPQIPAADQVGELGTMRKEGKIRHIGLSEVKVPEIGEARLTAPIASVQNLYNVLHRESEDVLDYCEREGLGFIPYCPIASGGFAGPAGPLARLGQQAGASGVQLALVWMLRRSPVMLPIPGTGSVTHLEENVGAAEIELTDDLFRALSALADPSLCAAGSAGRGRLRRAEGLRPGGQPGIVRPGRQPICWPADIRSSQASTTRAVIDSSAALPQDRGSYSFLLPTSPSTLSTPS
jgi:pyridoxine 4-dehydrogenase